MIHDRICELISGRGVSGVASIAKTANWNFHVLYSNSQIGIQSALMFIVGMVKGLSHRSHAPLRGGRTENRA